MEYIGDQARTTFWQRSCHVILSFFSIKHRVMNPVEMDLSKRLYEAAETIIVLERQLIAARHEARIKQEQIECLEIQVEGMTKTVHMHEARLDAEAARNSALAAAARMGKLAV